MRFIQGISRHQIQLNSLEEKITADNPIWSNDTQKLSPKRSRRATGILFLALQAQRNSGYYMPFFIQVL